MKLIIAKIDQKIYEGKFQKVSAPATAGDVEIMPGHTPLLSPLKEGTVTYITESGEEKSIQIKKGFLEINADEVIIVL